MSNKNAVNNGGDESFTIVVETLTGTSFEIKVSPLDTVKSIKTKIQRVEGIPVSHQHLLYNSVELDDSACVTEPTVALHDGSTVKLVLSMRGGPISLVHQAVPLNRTILKNLVKFSREEVLEDLPPGCRMAILVLRVGDQLNLFHVVEDDDDSDSSSSGLHNSMDSLLESESSKSTEENTVTMEKVCDLKQRMEKLSLQRKSNKGELKSVEIRPNQPAVNVVKPIKSSNSLKLPSLGHPVQGEILKSRSEFSQVPILPDIIPDTSSRELEEVISVEGATASNQICDTMRPKSCPGSVTEAQFYDMFGEDDCQDNIQFAQPHFRPCVSACTSKLRHEWGGGKTVLQSLNILPPITSVADVLNNHRKVSNIEPRNSQTAAVPFIENLNINHRNLNTSFKFKQDLTKESQCRLRKSDSTFVSRNTKYTSTPQDTSSEDFNCNNEIPSLKNYDLLPKIPNISPPHHVTTMELSSGSVNEKIKNISIDPSVSKKVTFDKKSRLRCAECKKRLSLAGVFECRCGFTFCSYHRYSETHHCTYNFKKESRKVLEQANPLVVAPKLPKI